MLPLIPAERARHSWWLSRNGGKGMFTDNLDSEGPAPGTTGKYLVLLREDAVDAGVRTLSDAAGLSVTSSSDFDEGGVDGEALAEAEGVVFDELAVAVVDTPPDQIQALSAATAEQEESPILAIEPERVVYALQDGSSAPEVPTPVPGSGAGLPVEFLSWTLAITLHSKPRRLAF